WITFLDCAAGDPPAPCGICGGTSASSRYWRRLISTVQRTGVPVSVNTENFSDMLVMTALKCSLPHSNVTGGGSPLPERWLLPASLIIIIFHNGAVYPRTSAFAAWLSKCRVKLRVCAPPCWNVTIGKFRPDTGLSCQGL